jgi:hypothetical protein
MQAESLFSGRDVLWSLLISIGMFGLLGTVAALWDNPLFMRMTPTSGFEVFLLVAQSALAGIYLGVRRAPCAGRVAGTGGILGFLGVACPVCNKLLVLAFGSALLLEYFEPLRLYVGLAGTGLLGYAVYAKLIRPSCTARPDLEQSPAA